MKEERLVGGRSLGLEYVEVQQQPLKVDSTDESSLILPWEMRDGGGGGGARAGYALHTLSSLLPVDSADEPP